MKRTPTATATTVKTRTIADAFRHAKSGIGASRVKGRGASFARDSFSLSWFPTRRRDRTTDGVRCTRAGAEVDARGTSRARGREISIERESESEDDEASLARDEATLREFDLTSAYGPALGLTRLERWDRARAYGLDPPKAVLEALQRRGSVKAKWRECVWFGRV